MELAKTLIRSVARAFYNPEHILIIDAVLLHSTLRDDELAYVMGSQTKHVRRLCFKLREDGLLQMHSQQEIRQGANRSSSRDYYYINYHLAIDNIKWRLKSMQREIVKKHGQTEEEKKDYVCPQCKSEFTHLDVMDTTNWEGYFTCKRCGHVLQMRTQEDEDNAGNEKVSRLNAQLAVFEDLMRQIDSTNIPENDWPDADAAKRPIEREHETNVVARSERVMPKVAGTTHGLKIEEDRLQVSVQDSKGSQDLAAAQREERIKKLGDNALPVWIAESTITGEQTQLGREEQEARERREREFGLFPARTGVTEHQRVVREVEESAHMKAYRAAMMEAQEQEAKDEDEEDFDDDDEDNDDEFENVDFEESRVPTKRAKIDGETAMTSDVPGIGGPTDGPVMSGGGASTNDLRVRATTDVEVTSSAGKGADEEDSDEDDDEFENVI